MSKSSRNSSNVESFVAGLLAGAMSTLVLHPFELVKVRMQVDERSSKKDYKLKVAPRVPNRPRYNGVFDALRQIYQHNGSVRGLYQGVVPNLWGSSLSWGLYFMVYNGLKTWWMDGSSTKNLSPLVHMLNGFLAGSFTMVLTNPIWMMKTRLCLQYENIKKYDGKPPVTYYNGMIDGLYKVIKNEGFFALYRGFGFGILSTLHGSIQFATYEYVKTIHHELLKGVPLDIKFIIIYSGMSKISAVFATYPFQLIRSRLQEQHNQYANGREVISRILRYEGPRAFYKGIFPTLLRVTPASCITFSVYETVSRTFKQFA